MVTIKKVRREWTTYNGKEMVFDGYDVTIPNEMGHVTKSVETLVEAFGLVGKYDNEADAIDRRAKEISEFLTKDENKKWR